MWNGDDLKTPRARFVLRASLIVVAAVALVLGVGIGLFDLGRRAGVYQERSTYHAQREWNERHRLEGVLAHNRRNHQHPETDAAYQAIQSLVDSKPRAD